MLPTLLLLPGLHGTADLFAPFLAAVPQHFPRRAISYPIDQYLSYAELLVRIEDEVKQEQSMVLIAESFSGPLAIRFAAAHPDRVRAIALCASFVRLPRPPWYRRLLAPILFYLPVLPIALRRYLAGPESSNDLVFQLRNSLRRGQPKILLARLRESFRVNEVDALNCCRMPLLYLAGSRDRLMPPQARDPILSVRPDTIVRTIDGPHMLLQARPEECWKEIHRFLVDASLT